MRQTEATIRSREETGKDTITLEIEVPQPVVEKELDRVYRRIANEIAIPGFRRGKAPRAVVEKRIGRESFIAEAQKELVHDAFVEVLMKSDLKPVSSEILEVDLADGKPLVFKVAVTREPLLEVDGYRGVAVKVARVEVTEEGVESALADLRNRYAKMVLVKERAAERGDVALLEFTGHDEAGAVIEKASEKNFRVELGSGQTVPGFEDGVVGMNLAEERDVECVFPADYRETSLAGRKVRFHMKLKELKRRVLPEADDDFAKELGEYETVDALRAHLRGELEKQAAERRDDAVKAKVLDALLARHEDVAVPEAMIETCLDRIERHLDNDLRMYRQSLEKILAQSGKTRDDFRADSRPRARRMALADILIGSIAAREGVVASEPDVAAKVTEWAENMGVPFEDMKKRLEAEGGMRTIREEIVSSKVKDLLARTAVVEYVDVDPDDPGQGHDHGHDHGPDCGCGHDHGDDHDDDHDDDTVEASFDGKA